MGTRVLAIAATALVTGRTKRFGSALAFALALMSPAHAMKPLPSATVQTASGPVTGTVTGTISTFLGIPYAAPPVGTLRWRPPQPRAPWTTPRDATTFGPMCPQGAVTDEDCLFLN